ncbi:hypothetical protein GCK72_021268 [Caenorhabditis remanei]|uniref:F-box domain-containing protein n=1 Tax=Caenorhabditis remanei TaxID=31234 RepID=A0A6A5GIT0_CAERE|nr:hypothetical protein GCK72_021268 [Caenorhabditis remanei]KAF1754704.1 hypothetical protein GCK72_021268 [Caenorhabditis remanei]
MTTGFPLLRLPYLVLMPILEQMHFVERITLSVLSKRARMFLKLLKMKCEYTNFQLKYGTIEAEVFLDNFEVFKLELYISGHLEFKYRQDVLLWSTMGVPPMDYAVSIMDVMHCKSIHQFTIAKISMECNTLPLLVNLPKIDKVVVHSDLYDVSPVKSRLCKVLRIVLPISSAVSFSYDVLNPKDLREIFKANFDAVTVILKDCDDDMPNHKMFSLNDLRRTNIKTLEVVGAAVEVEDVNRYFKWWMKKKCNIHLEYLQVASRRRLGSEVINLLLKGLNAVQVPIKTERTFRVLENMKQFIPEDSNEEITSEFDITRVDGRTATIRISNYRNVIFYVWPESTNNTTNLEPN